MKKVNITTAVLLIYLIVMSIIGWPGQTGRSGLCAVLLCNRGYYPRDRPVAFPADQTAEDPGKDERRKKGVTKFNCKYKILIHEGPCDRTVPVRDGQCV